MKRYIDANCLIREIEISRDNNNHNNVIAFQTHNNEHRHFIKMVLDQPTADVVEVRHGYWLSAYEYSMKFDISEERRNEVKNDRIWKFCCLCDQSAKWDYNYCPNCGAKMDGKGE